MEILNYENSTAYFIPNGNSDKLIISLEGSGWQSVLGKKNEKGWEYVAVAAGVEQYLPEYAILIPEKLKRQPGKNHINDMEDRENYTAQNIIRCYSESINNFLNENNFTSVVIIGSSEGGFLLPLVYEKIEKKDNIIALISFAAGGYSIYESYSVLNERQHDIPSSYKKCYEDVLNEFNPVKKEFNNSFEDIYHNHTYRWFNSIVHIRPFDYYKKINIPVLFIHGKFDINVAVESTMYIQENLPDKPFTYKYYYWAHGMETKMAALRVLSDVAEWIREIDG